MSWLGSIISWGSDIVEGVADIAEGAVSFLGGSGGGSTVASALGSVASDAADLVGFGKGGALGAIFDDDTLSLGADLFAPNEPDPWGEFFNSPVAGHIIGSIGSELLREDPPTPEEQARALGIAERERLKARREHVRGNYRASSDPNYTPYQPRRRNGLISYSRV